jgi:hypothetical protein
LATLLPIGLVVGLVRPRVAVSDVPPKISKDLLSFRRGGVVTALERNV